MKKAKEKAQSFKEAFMKQMEDQNVADSAIMGAAIPAAGALTGGAIDAFTGEQSFGEVGLNIVQPIGNAALGAGLGAGLGYVTRDQSTPKTAPGVYVADPGARQRQDGVRRTARSAAIGAAASLVPRILGMRDQQVVAQQAAQLM